MAIFNSLGSNYSAKFVWRDLIWPRKPGARTRTKKILEEKYGGHATLTYKGRQALELALKRLELPAGSSVGINGFTCYVVYQAVERAGLKPIFIDVPPRQLNFNADGLKAAHTQNPQLRAIIVQNTLGAPSDIPALAAYCRAHDISIVEDLAHSIGARYVDGREAGTVGNMTMLSFSQDKPLDVVAGGALVDRREKVVEKRENFPSASLWQRTKNRMYPLWTALIRATYPLGLGRLIHFVFKKLHLMATPMSDNLDGLQRMTGTAAGLLAIRWRQQEAEATHRRTITGIYKKELPSELFLPEPEGQAVYLRFPMWVDDRASLIADLKKAGIYIGDTWYDAPIGPKKYLARTNYQVGECPNAEALASHIVNLPTHIHVDENKARFIAGEVRKWL